MQGNFKMAIGLSLVLLFGSSIAANAAYTGPNRAETRTLWERQNCHYQAVYDPPGPGSYGCYLDQYSAPNGSCPSSGSVAVAWEAGQAVQMLLGKYSESCTFALDTAVPRLRSTLQKRAKTAESWTLNMAARSIAQLENREGPFTRGYCDAYSSLRAIALADKEFENEEVAILFVDIHT